MATRREFIKQALLTGASLPLMLAACQQSAAPGNNTKKAIVIGIDGMDPVVVQEMMQRGQLPPFSRLAETGGFSPLISSNPPQSPVA